MTVAWNTLVGMPKRLPTQASQALKPPPETLGQRIRRFRLWRGLEQSDVAEAIGQTGPATVSRWENNVNTPSMKSLKALSGVLQVDYDELLGEAPISSITFEEPTTFDVVRNVIEADDKLTPERKKTAVDTLRFILGNQDAKKVV